MLYECKIFTDEAFQARQNFIDAQLGDKTGMTRYIEKMQMEDHLNLLNRKIINGKPIHDWELEIPVEVREPSYTIQQFKPAEVGYQSQPRIEWRGEIKKIDEIERIFSFKRVEL